MVSLDIARRAAPDPALERALRDSLEGEVAFDAFTRGRYATDASIYQIIPQGVVFPKSRDDIEAALKIAAAHGVAVIARGGGTSQNGQPIGSGLVLDMSRHLDRVTAYDREARSITVEPGVVLKRLNARVRSDGLFFPVEPSTASRCTIGGMAGNNSCGARSIRYGKMVDNVIAISAFLHDGEAFGLGPAGANAPPGGISGSPRVQALMRDMLALADRERAEIVRRFPKVQRRVGGYNLDELLAPRPNLSHLLVGSEGTLAISSEITLKLSPLPGHRVMGVCHFPSFRAAMETTRPIVALAPVAVELVDNNILALGADIPLFRSTLADITKGKPDCLLLVEFAGDDLAGFRHDLRNLDQCMGDHGFADAVVEVVEPARQRQVWDMREACLNIMMSMKGDAKPVSFIEDCAVPLEHLADYTDAITGLFRRHGTRGTWYAHASVGCLHVRPILNLKEEAGLKAMRAIAEEATDLVRAFKGSHSGEHGDGLSRSEFHQKMFGKRLVKAFEAVKDGFDPKGRLNPGKIVRAPAMDERTLLRFPAGYRTSEPERPALDWSDWGGFGGAVEMCNNNGACRRQAGGVMCPSWRVTQNEQHVTRGRASTLRLAISGQLGPGAFTSTEMKETLALCVSCKGCRRECPTGVDMARMKIEFLHHYHQRHGLPLKERLIAFLPRYSRAAGRMRPLLNLRDRVPGLALLSEKTLGFSARRSLPRWQRPWVAKGAAARPEDIIGDGRDIVLFGDTFNRHFEPENLAAAERVLGRAGYRLHRAEAGDGGRSLCCGRTFLAAGLVDEARTEARRTFAVLGPLIVRGARIAGLEPSCMMTFRDEYFAMLPRAEVEPVADAALLLEEVLAADDPPLPLRDHKGRIAHVHHHCHQKAFATTGAAEAVLGKVPGLEVRPIESSCCGMAGAFGYDASTIDHSLAMAELSLLPAVRQAAAEDIIVASGTSCRHQIHDGAGREALHLARVLDAALMPG